MSTIAIVPVTDTTLLINSLENIPVVENICLQNFKSVPQFKETISSYCRYASTGLKAPSCSNSVESSKLELTTGRYYIHA